MRALSFAAGVAGRLARVGGSRSRLAWAPCESLVLVRPLRPRAWVRERMLAERRTLVQRERVVERLVTRWRTAPAAREPVRGVPARGERLAGRGTQREHMEAVTAVRQRGRRVVAEPAAHRAAASRPNLSAVPALAPRRMERGSRSPSVGASRAAIEPAPVPPAPRVVAARRERAPSLKRARSARPDMAAPAARDAGPAPGATEPAGRGTIAQRPDVDRVEPRASERVDVERLADEVLQRLERMAVARRERMGAA